MSKLWQTPSTRCAHLSSGIGEISCVEVRDVLVEGRSRFQDYAIIDTVPYGRILVLDNVIQSAAFDEWTYHESFVIPPMCAVREPRRVLVLGGGEGAMVREVLRHPSVVAVTMVDIDEEVVTACRRFLPDQHRGSFDDPRLRLIFDDARAWLERFDDEPFDVILVDLTEPLDGGPSDKLFTREFYQLVARSLSPGGVMALQAGSVRLNYAWAYAQVIRTLDDVFPRVLPYATWITSFAEQWGFAMAGEAGLDHFGGDELDARCRERALEPRFLDGITFEGLRRLPLFVRQQLVETDAIATDENPLSIQRESSSSEETIKRG
jgi:spermidine synthase